MSNQKGAFYTGKYRNVFLEFGYSEEEIEKKIAQTFEQLFFGDDNTRIYYPVGDDMGYLLDTGNLDVRTEGQSYGMMMAVQMNTKNYLTGYGSGHSRIWHDSGKYNITLPGRVTPMALVEHRPAPDGEEYCHGLVVCFKPLG